MAIVKNARPSRVGRWILRLPFFVYKFGLLGYERLFGQQWLALTTKGRRTGKPHLRLSLAGYSYRKYLDLKKPSMTLFDFAELAAGLEVDAIEPTAYYFPETTPQYLAPPGYLSVDQLKQRAAMADKMHGGFDFDAISKSFFIAVGTPDKVANQLGEWSQWMKTSHINCVMHVADMPHWKTVKNLTLMAEEVIPRLRARVQPALRAAAE